jgi:hypothetical protein
MIYEFNLGSNHWPHLILYKVTSNHTRLNNIKNITQEQINLIVGNDKNLDLLLEDLYE